MEGGHFEKRNVGPNENYPLFQKHNAGCNVDSSSILHMRSLPLLRSRCKNTCLFKYSRKFLQVLICNENLVSLNKILHADQTYLSLCGTSYAMVASCTHQCLSHRCVERQLKQSSKYQSIERKATRKYIAQHNSRWNKKVPIQKCQKHGLCINMNFTSDAKFSAQKLIFEILSYSLTQHHLFHVAVLGQSGLAPTSTSWRMNDKWSGINFLLDSGSLTNHGCYLSFIFSDFMY